jgi:FSR family fosmidomycin resistance protein-like MFS transporter
MTALLVGQGLQPLIGLLGDRVGGRGLSVLGLFGTSVGAGLVGLVGSPAALVAVLVLIGISNSFFHPLSLAGVRQLGLPRQGLAISTFLVGGEIGRGVWPILATLCVAYGGLQWLVLLALPGLASTLILFRSAPALPRRARDAEPIAWSKHAGPLALLVGFCALRSFATFAAITLLPLLWSRGGGTLTSGASLITILTLVGVIGNLSGGWLADHLGPPKILFAALFLSGVGAVLLSFSSGIWLWLLAAVLGIGLFATLPLTVLIAQDQLPENRSFGSGLALGLANGLGAVAIVVIGPVIDLIGPSLSFWLAAIAAFAACALVPWMPGLDSGD